jgi:hypothetical protein
MRDIATLSLAVFPSVKPAEYGLFDKRPKSINNRG